MNNRCEITQQNLRMWVDEIIYLIEEAKRVLKIGNSLVYAGNMLGKSKMELIRISITNWRKHH